MEVGGAVVGVEVLVGFLQACDTPCQPNIRETPSTFDFLSTSDFGTANPSQASATRHPAIAGPRLLGAHCALTKTRRHEQFLLSQCLAAPAEARRPWLCPEDADYATRIDAMAVVQRSPQSLDPLITSNTKADIKTSKPCL